MRLDHITPKDLIAFEADIADSFARKQIRHPIHLSSGNEQRLWEIFRDYVGPEDWIFCSWRAHLHCLLKGVPPAQLKADILRGRSIALCYPEYRIFSSAIVGGAAPIAVGVANALKANKSLGRAICFVGDMTNNTGIVQECQRYSYGHNLNMLWIVEDNGLSVLTDTEEVWPRLPKRNPPQPIRYNYGNKYPHCGIARYVEF